MEKRETARERERERSRGIGEIRVSNSEGVRTEERKSKRKREKVRELILRKRRHQKIMFPAAIDEDNIYRRCNA